MDVRGGALGPVPARQLSLAQSAGAWHPFSRHRPKVFPALLPPTVLPRDSAVWQARPEEPLPLPAPALFSSFWARWVLA